MNAFFLQFVTFEFARNALFGVLLVALLGGLLAPMIVMKSRSYVGDTIAHLVFPGIVIAFMLQDVLPLWLVLATGTGASALLGLKVADRIREKLRVPDDAAYVVTLTGFFACGLIWLSSQKNLKVNLERLLLGDVLTVTPTELAVMAALFAICVFVLISLRRHWDVWVCDPEFGTLAGYRTRLVARLFPILVAASVLVSMFLMGALVVSALFVLPGVLVRTQSIVSLKAIAVSILLGVTGLVISFVWNIPAGPAIVASGFMVSLARSFIKSP